MIEKKKDNFIDQDEAEVSYAKKISKKESKIDWNVKAEKVIAKINALHPSPGSWFYYNGVRHKVIRAIEVEEKAIREK